MNCNALHVFAFIFPLGIDLLLKGDNFQFRNLEYQLKITNEIESNSEKHRYGLTGNFIIKRKQRGIYATHLSDRILF